MNPGNTAFITRHAARRTRPRALAMATAMACGAACADHPGGANTPSSLAAGTAVATFGTSFAANPGLGGPIIEDMDSPFSFNTSAGQIIGVLHSRVVISPRDNNLSFYWRIDSDVASKAPVVKLLLTGWSEACASASTPCNPQADFRLDGPGSVGPFEATRSSGTGSNIGFDFQGGIAPGAGSYPLLLNSNSSQYGLLGFARLASGDGLSAPIPTFMPSAVPEPQTWALLLAGLGAMGLLRRRADRAGASQAARAVP